MSVRDLQAAINTTVQQSSGRTNGFCQFIQLWLLSSLLLLGSQLLPMPPKTPKSNVNSQLTAANFVTPVVAPNPDSRIRRPISPSRWVCAVRCPVAFCDRPFLSCCDSRYRCLLFPCVAVCLCRTAAAAPPAPALTAAQLPL